VIFLYSSIFLLTFFLDRITKFWAFNYLQNKTVSCCRFLDFSLHWNRGVSWGMFGESSRFGFYALNFFILLVIGFFVFYTFDQYRQKQSVFFETFVFSGAISNFFDRIYYGAVIDFIDFHVSQWHWPVFNVADAFIVIGIGGIILRGFLWALRKK